MAGSLRSLFNSLGEQARFELGTGPPATSVRGEGAGEVDVDAGAACGRRPGDGSAPRALASRLGAQLAGGWRDAPNQDVLQGTGRHQPRVQRPLECFDAGEEGDPAICPPAPFTRCSRRGR